MFHRIIIATCLTSFGLLGLTPTPAAAEGMPPRTEVQAQVEDEVLWIEASLGQPDGTSLRIDINAPRVKRAGRILWQRCEFVYSGSGTYRCGIDVGPGSLTGPRSATWLAEVVLDGERVAKKRFSVTDSL